MKTLFITAILLIAVLMGMSCSDAPDFAMGNATSLLRLTAEVGPAGGFYCDGQVLMRRRSDTGWIFTVTNCASHSLSCGYDAATCGDWEACCI